jgi:hypothetical protein
LGGHLNYNHIIQTLVIFKNELTKDTPLVHYLRRLEYHAFQEEDNLPTNQDLADLFKTTRTKINKQLKDLYDNLIDSSWYRPIEINRLCHTIFIWIPPEEREYRGKRNSIEWREDDREVVVRMNLPVTPRLGDRIHLPFVEANKHQWGYVYEVDHMIHGDIQDISIYVHPFRSFYHQWMKMKEEHESWVNRLKRI